MDVAGEDLVNSGFVVLAVWLWFWSQRAISRKPPPPVAGGIGDRLFTWGTPVNRWYHDHPRAADLTLIVTSFFIDVLAVYMFAVTVVGDTLRPFLAVLVVFAMRQLCEYLVTLPDPDGMIWRHPGSPSLLVTYKTENDFFFSGHMFPLDIIPEPYQTWIQMLPLKYLAYFPAAVFLEQIPREELWREVAFEAGWVMFFIAFSRWLMNAGYRRYSGFGG